MAGRSSAAAIGRCYRPLFSAALFGRLSRPLVSAALLLLTLAACGGKKKQEGLRVGLITPGSITDAAWNSGAYKGLEAIRDSLGLAISHVEARTPAAQEEALRAYAAQGYRLVLAHGYEFQLPAERVSLEYPNTFFVVTSGSRAAANVSPLIFRLEEASYLAGMAAGGLTKSNVIGFVGGVELPPVKAAYEGWVAGARAVNSRIDTKSTYLNNWDDAALGREAALALIRAGADVFHHNADAAAFGLFQAAKETPGVLVFGANADQASLAPDHVPGSAVIDLPRAFLLVAREVKDDNFSPRLIAFGIDSNVVRYVPNPAFASRLPPGLAARIEAARDSLIEGTLQAAVRPAQMQASTRARVRASTRPGRQASARPCAHASVRSRVHASMRRIL
jgi:basic membrane lipoprotein Med (substrate-binding protein (PBP1-ABC) superfamily)